MGQAKNVLRGSFRISYLACRISLCSVVMIRRWSFVYRLNIQLVLLDIVVTTYFSLLNARYKPKTRMHKNVVNGIHRINRIL